ncbi:MAG TPA: hypothetical protein VMV90_06025 [Rectinemataceae bacterium]|nr:hypothetical protein [Rectinemataceae bacterium]
MAFGSLRRVDGRSGLRQVSKTAAAAVLTLCYLALSACSPAARESRFAVSLGSIDSALAVGRSAERAFASAARNAATGADWLSLIKRALRAEAAGEKGIAASMARKALVGAPGSDAAAFGAAYAFLRTEHPASALALFPSRLSRQDYPRLWAEAFVETARHGELPASELDAASLGALGSIAGEPRLFISAAVAALAAGDEASAQAWLRRAVAGGAVPDTALMWDCGLYPELAARSDAGAGPEDLCIMGDAAWRVGDFAAAQDRWQRAIGLNPRVSWKAYLKLALLAGSGTELQASYFARLRAAFVDLPQARADPEAVTAYAAYLARSGQRSRALTMLGPYSQNTDAGALALTIEGLNWPEARFVAAAESFAAARPQSGRALGYALRVLFERGRFADMSVLYATGQARGLDYPYRRYYGAAIDAAYGRFAASASALEAQQALDRPTEAPSAEDLYADFALGTLELRSNDFAKAVDYLSRSRDAASDGKTSCAILKELGRAQAAAGDREAALASWREALRADPRDPEAALLAKGLPAVAP